MGLFGFSSKKEVEQKEREAKMAGMAAGAENVLNDQQTNLANLGKGSQVNFAVPFFDIFDPRLPETGVPVSVQGSITYAVDNIDLYNSINKSQNLSDEAFRDKMKATVTKFVKGCITNVPDDCQIPVVQIERKIMDISEYVTDKVAAQIEKTLGVTVRSLDITEIMVDKQSRGFKELKSLTSDLSNERLMAQHKMSMSDMKLQHETDQSNFRLNNSLQQNQLKKQSSLQLDAMERQQEMQLSNQEEMQKMQLEMQRLQNVDALKMQMENQRETMRIQREEMQRASKLQTEQTFLGAHKANIDASLTNKAMDNGINTFSAQQQPMGGGMFAQQQPIGGGMFAQQQPMGGSAPQMPGMKVTVPQVQYMVGVNGQQAGPFDWNQLQQLVNQGQLTQQSYVWTQGMAQWDFAGNVQELMPLFAGTAPQMPPSMPGM